MNEIKKLWDALKNMLHHGPSTQPLWQAVIDKLHEFEARITALEQHPAVSIPALTPVEQAKPVEDVKPVEEPKPTEQIIHPDTPAAASAIDSSAAGDKAGPDSPTASPSPEGAGQDNAHAHEEGHDEKGSGEQHGE